MAVNTGQHTRPYSEPFIDNQSFDPEFQVRVTEILGYNESNNTLERIKTENGILPSSLPTGAATSVNQDTLNSLIDTLQELIQRLAPLAGAMNNMAQLRVVATGAVTATGGGYITSAQSIAEKAVAGISYTPRVAQENLTAILSNVNNCTGV